MLRITSETVDGVRTLKLEGNISGAWVMELRRALQSTCAERVRLDLSAVRYVDSDGAALLREVMRGGADVIRRSTFVAQLLEGGLQ